MSYTLETSKILYDRQMTIENYEHNLEEFDRCSVSAEILKSMKSVWGFIYFPIVVIFSKKINW